MANRKGSAKKHSGGSASGRNKLWLRKGRDISRLIVLMVIVSAIAIPCALLLERAGGRARGIESAPATLVISELMSENMRTLVTDAGEVPDWIDVRNDGDAAVSMNHWALVLESNPNRAYSFPNRELAPGEHLLIYAVGSDAKGECDAPFRLSASGGEALVLLNPQGKAADVVELPELSADCSYRRTDGGAWEICASPTPGGSDTATLSVRPAAQGAVGELELTEVMSANGLYFPDEDGECCDYVELHNRSGASVNLEGWYLSDSVSKLKRWAFPAVTLPANGYMLVHCSGKNRTSDPVHLHADFKLSSAGEGVYLTRPNGEVESSVEFPVLERNQAWSLYEGEWSAKLAPTPGWENSAEAAGRAQAQRFQSALGGVYLSEIMASPTNEDYDWIELCNGSNQAVDLGGWGLSDDASRPRRWQFPSGTYIQPGEYLGVFLTGDASVQAKGYLSADFALSTSGGYTVCLSDPSGAILDAVYLGEQSGGISYARFPGEEGFFYAAEPTPLTTNSGAHYRARTPMPQASVQGGLHRSGESFTVELSAPADCRIYYTLDCTDPTENSTLYTGPIHVSGTTILRSRAYRDGSMPSYIAAQSYLYDVEVPEGVYVISLVSDPDNLYSDSRGILVMGPNAWAEYPYGKINSGANFWMDWEREANVELFTSSGELGFAQPCGIKLHGQYSRAGEVKAFKVFARSEYGDNRFDYPIFRSRDYDSYQSFLLRASGQDYDKTFMRDSVLCALAKDTSLMYQETELGVCYLNGEYYSLFNLRERVSRFSICQFEGWEGMEDDVDLIKANNIEKEGSNASMEELLDWIKKNDTSTQAAYDYIAERIDIQNYIEYMAMEIYSGNGDTLNVKRYRNARTDGKWRWVLYDLDWAFTVDTNSIRRWLDPEGMGTNKYTDTTLFIGCMKNPVFREQFLTYFGEQLATTLSTENVMARIQERYDALQPLLPAYLEKIGKTMNNYNSAMKDLAEYAQSRPEKIIGYFRDTFKFSDADLQKYFGAAIEKIRQTQPAQ